MVGMYRTNYLTNIDGDSLPNKKRRSEMLALYDIEENSSNEGPQPSKQTLFYITQNNKNLN